MKKHTLIVVFGLLFHLANAQQTVDKQMVTGFDKMLSQHFKHDEPGGAVLLAKNGRIIYQKAFGMANLELAVPMRADHVFKIGSITKQFTAVAILQLMEQGKLSLRDEITRFIPDYPTQGAKITIEHLLTHTSGIQSYTAMKDYTERMTLDLPPTEVIDHFKNQPMRFAPGTRWEYSNSNYFLLGYIIEQLTRKTYGEYLEESLFKPGGMSSSQYGSGTKIIKNRIGGYSKGDKGFENARPLSMTQPYAAGAILSTVADMFKWHQAVLTNKLVKKESIQKAFSRYKLTDGQETDYGYGWRFGNVQESLTIEHGGAINGFKSMEIYLPGEDVFVVIFSNCDCSPVEEIAARIAALTIGKPYERNEIFLDSSILKGYAGVYENANGEQRIITVTGNQLYSQRGRNPKYKLKAWQQDRFVFDDPMLAIDFSRNTIGEIAGLTTKSRGRSEVWNKTNNPIRVQTEISVDEKILETYVGLYEISPDFSFSVTKEHGSLFLQATGQEKLELFSETETKFFLKVNDAQLEFIKDESGKTTKAILKQGGRKTDARKIK